MLGSRAPAVLALADAELQRPTFDAAAVAEVLALDAPLAIQVLRHAHEPPAMMSAPPRHLLDAVHRLGRGALQRLLRPAHGACPEDTVLRDEFALLFERALIKAQLAATLAAERGDDAEIARVAGLVDEAGRLLLARRHPGEYYESWTAGADLEAERDRFGTDHRCEAARLFRAWRIPPVLCAVVGREHSDCQQTRTLIELVHTADELADEAGFLPAAVRRSARAQTSPRAEEVCGRALPSAAFRALEECARRLGRRWRAPGDLADALVDSTARPARPRFTAVDALALLRETDSQPTERSVALWMQSKLLELGFDRAFVLLHDEERATYVELLRSEESLLREPVAVDESELEACAGGICRNPGNGSLLEALGADELLAVGVSGTNESRSPLILCGDHRFRGAPFDDEDRARLELVAAVAASHLERHRLEQAVEELREDAERDYLTGIHNRRSTMRQLEREMNRARRTATPLALALLDIDNFKTFNDTYGHLAGDAVLREVARLLSETARESDVVGRYGGEEFLIVLPDAPIEAAYMFAERLRSVVEQYGLEKLHQFPDNPPTISIGVSWVVPERDTPESAIERADKALYGSKRSGRNRVCLEPAEHEP